MVLKISDTPNISSFTGIAKFERRFNLIDLISLIIELGKLLMGIDFLE